MSDRGTPKFRLRLTAFERGWLDRAAEALDVSTSQFLREAALRDANLVLGGPKGLEDAERGNDR